MAIQSVSNRNRCQSMILSCVEASRGPLYKVFENSVERLLVILFHLLDFSGEFSVKRKRKRMRRRRFFRIHPLFLRRTCETRSGKSQSTGAASRLSGRISVRLFRDHPILALSVPVRILHNLAIANRREELYRFQEGNVPANK